MNDSNSSSALATEGDVTARAMSTTLICIGAPTVLMNIFVITIIVSYKWMRSHMSVLIICSMAITDLLAGLVTITAAIVRWTNWVTVGRAFCLVFHTLDVWAAMASLGHVLAVNVERYLAIVFPLKHKHLLSTNRVKLMLLGVWTVTLAEALCQSFAYNVTDRCENAGPALPVLGFAVNITSAVIPFLSVLVIYIHIVTVLVRKIHFMAHSASLDAAVLARTQRKMFGTVSGILAAWIICWLPLTCLLLTNSGAHVFNIIVDMNQFIQMFHYVEVMSYGNSLLNPILYFLTSSDFRKAGRAWFHCKSTNREDVVSPASNTSNTRV